MAAVLEGDADCTRDDKLFVLASVFITIVPLERESVREVYSIVARVSS